MLKITKKTMLRNEIWLNDERLRIESKLKTAVGDEKIRKLKIKLTSVNFKIGMARHGATAMLNEKPKK